MKEETVSWFELDEPGDFNKAFALINNEIHIPSDLFDDPLILYNASFDGVGVIDIKGDLYLPTGWLLEQYHEDRGFIKRVERKLRESISDLLKTEGGS